MSSKSANWFNGTKHRGWNSRGLKRWQKLLTHNLSEAFRFHVLQVIQEKQSSKRKAYVE